MSNSSESPQTTVVLMIGKLQGGGAERAVAALANAWAEQGKHVHIVLTSKQRLSQNDDYEVVASVRRHDLGGKVTRRHVSDILPSLRKPLGWAWKHTLHTMLTMGSRGEKLAFALSRWRRRHIVAELRTMLVQMDDPILFVFTASLFPLAVLACEGNHTRFVAMERNDPTLAVTHPEVALYRPLACKLASIVTANSRTALRALAKFTSREKLLYVPNPLFNSDALRTPLDEQAREQTILIVARLAPQKNHEVLIRAFAMLPATLQAWRLSIVGDGECRPYLEELARRLGIADRIEWHGYTPDPFPHYRRASIFVLPSQYEGQSNAVLEAMSFGLPVVVSDTPSLCEMVEDMQHGLIVPCQDVGALARARLSN